MADGYSIKDMQQIMMSEQKAQRDILEKQTATLGGIESHLKELNGKVARHQETLYEKDRGHGDRLSKLEGWQIKIMATISAITAIAVILFEQLIKIFL